MLPLILNFDDSVAAQAAIAGTASEIVDLTALRDSLRLSASPNALDYLRKTLQQLRAMHPEPWLTFLGSGDFHHIALALIESLPKENPFHLILIDNHPDWFFERPTFHCGNWVSGALDYVETATLLGQDSPDLKGYRFRRAPFDCLCDGRVKFYPQSLTQIFVPLKWPTKTPDPFVLEKGSGVLVSPSRFGTRLSFDAVQKKGSVQIKGSDQIKGDQIKGDQIKGSDPFSAADPFSPAATHGASPLFTRIANDLAGKDVYLSIDKDVLRPGDAVTDWEHGQLTLDELTAGIRMICTHCRVIGADTCGDHSRYPLTGLWKRLDAGRWKSHAKPNATEVNQRANLAILSAFDLEPSVPPIRKP